MYEQLSATELDELAMQGRISVGDYWRARIALDQRAEHEQPTGYPVAQVPQPPVMQYPIPPGAQPAGSAQPAAPVHAPAQPVAPAYKAQPAGFVAPPPMSAPGAGQWVRLGLEAPATDAAPTRADDSLSKRRFRRRRARG